MTHTVTSPCQDVKTASGDVKTASGNVRRGAAQGPSIGAGMKCSRGTTGAGPQESNTLMQGQGDVVAALSLGLAAVGTRSSRVPEVTGKSGYPPRATVKGWAGERGGDTVNRATVLRVLATMLRETNFLEQDPCLKKI